MALYIESSNSKSADVSFQSEIKFRSYESAHFGYVITVFMSMAQIHIENNKKAAMKAIKKEDVRNYIGLNIKPTDWFTIKQEQINQFADCTMDHQFIHVDEEQAKKTGFGSTIAHGLLSLSMLPYFAENFAYLIDGTYMGVNYGFDKVRFINPVKVNSRIRAHAELIDVEEKKPGQFIFKMEVSIEIEGEEKPALKAVWLTMQMLA